MSNTSDSRIIYEIFRACRLCGAGGGYKMPIIQNVIPFDDFADVELREKIRECVQIEVRSDDKMPPLICELCVDKVNDFYEFLEMCRLTNKRTRLRLGLPYQTIPQGETEDCILGVTETVFSNDEDKSSVVKVYPRSRPCPKSKKNIIEVKKEDAKIETPKSVKGKENNGNAMSKRLSKELMNLKNSELKSNSESPHATRRRESRIYADSRSSSVSARSSPTPARETRRKTNVGQSEAPRPSRRRRGSLASDSDALETRTRRSAKDDDLGKLKLKDQKIVLGQQKQTTKPATRKGNDDKVVILSDSDDETLSTARSKRGRDKDTHKPDIPQKKIKLTIKLSTPKVPTLAANECPACGFVASSAGGLASHMKRHPVLYTSPELACDPCGDWFPTAEQAETHHKKHTKYKCRRCKCDYRQLSGYNEHFEKKNCKLFDELPDVQCQMCWAFFPTVTLMQQHKCPGVGSRPGGSCKICTKLFTTQKSLKRHEDYCASKIKDTKPTKSELSKPTKTEIYKPIKIEISKPAKSEVSKPSRSVLSKLTKSEPKPAKSEVSKPSKSEHSKLAKSEFSKPTRSEVSKPTRSDVSKSVEGRMRVKTRVRSRLRPAAVRVAKCDPLLKQRKTRSGRYNVANVPHDYGLDMSRVYPYKYSGVRVKSEPLCFDGMVSINKEIQQEFYREEDYVHWDSDISSDSDNEEEIIGDKRKKVPTLTALTLKTIFSKRCLGKVPRKLRKVKQDKLFDSLFNATVDDDLSCNINSIIDNLSKDVGANYDSDSVLGGGDTLDGVIEDVNKGSGFDVNKTKSNECSDLKGKNDLFHGDDTDASTNDTQGDRDDEVANTDSGVSKENDKIDGESDRTEDLGSQNSDTQNDIFNSDVYNRENQEKDEETNLKTANLNENRELTNNFEDINKLVQVSNNDFEKELNQNIESQKAFDDENKESLTRNEETYKNGGSLNGDTEKSIHFSEIDDRNLMEELNAQIGESEMRDACNFSIDNLIDKSMPQSFGIGSIGDDEFL